MTVTARAGAARFEITPDAGVELLGYAAREGAARGCHDPLFARALCLEPATPDRAAILIVSVDLCLMMPDQAAQIREAIEQATGIPQQRVSICCTHTHSGPDLGLAARAAGKPIPLHVAGILEGIVATAGAAQCALRPASLRWRRGRTYIGRNRRSAQGPTDPELLVLEARAPAGDPIAVLVNHGCHPTVLGHENFELSADWPGAMTERIERTTGAVALFALGAHGDVDPRTRGLKDIAIAGGSRGQGFDAVRVLGCEVADAVLSADPLDGAAETFTRLGSSGMSLRLPLHLAELSESAARATHLQRRQDIAAQIEVPPDRLPRAFELEPFVRKYIRSWPVGAQRELLARVRRYVRDRTGPGYVGGQRRIAVELGVLHLGPVDLLTLPLEPTVEVGLDWKARSARRGRVGAVASITNGWLRYLPHPIDLADPQAHQHYEPLASLLAPGACEKLLTAADELAEAWLAEPRTRTP